MNPAQRRTAMLVPLAVLFLTVAAQGCGGGADSVLGGTVDVSLSLQDIDGNVRSEFVQAEPLVFILTIRNDTSEPAYFGFRSGCKASASVASVTGEEVWDFWKHAVCTDGLNHLTVQPGESESLDVVWMQRGDDGAPVPVGGYVGRGEIPENPVRVVNLVPFSIVAPSP